MNLSAADGDGSSNDSKPDFAPSPTGSPAVQRIVFQSDRSTAAPWVGLAPARSCTPSATSRGSAITPVFQVQSGARGADGPAGVPQCRTAYVATENPVFSPQGDQIAYDEPGPQQPGRLHRYDIEFSGTAGLMTTARTSRPTSPPTGPELGAGRARREHPGSLRRHPHSDRRGGDRGVGPGRAAPPVGGRVTTSTSQVLPASTDGPVGAGQSELAAGFAGVWKPRPRCGGRVSA